MNEPPRSRSDEPLDLLDLRRIDAIGDQYEAERQAGRMPEVTTLLASLPDRLRNQAFAELIRIERDLLQHGSWPLPLGGLSTWESPDARFQPAKLHVQGGRGRIWQAFDRELNRTVAVKDLLPGQADDAHLQQRFRREAQITGMLEHSGIVPVYGQGVAPDDRPFYAMRFIHGESFRDAIRRFHEEAGASAFTANSSRSLQQLLNRFIAVCYTIEYAHSRQVIHRDLKPENIMLAEYGETLVVDWGLAKRIDRESAVVTAVAPGSCTDSPADFSADQTEDGAIVGTPAYMSPEQATAQSSTFIGTAADIYSLGATLYFLLTGKAAYSGTTPEVLQAVAQGRLRRPRELNSAIPRPLEAICLKAMSRSIDQRYASARLLAVDLERWMADEPIDAHPDRLRERLVRWGKRHQAYLRAGIVALALITIVSTTAALLIQAAREQEILQRKRAESEGRVAREALAVAERERQVSVDAQKGEELRRAEAEIAERQARAATDFLISVFNSADPLGLHGLGLRRTSDDARPLTAIEILRRGAERVDDELDADPAIQYRILDSLGAAFLGQGELEEAERLIERAAALRPRGLPADHPDRHASEWNQALVKLARGESHEAAKRLRTILLNREQSGIRPAEIARIHFYLGFALSELYQSRESLAHMQTSLEIQQHELGSRHPETVMSRMLVLDLLTGLGYQTEAQQQAKLLAEAIDPLTAFTLATAALRYSRMEQHRRRQEFQPALELCDGLIRDSQRILGNDHAITRLIESERFLLIRYQGRIREAEEFGQKLFEKIPRILSRSPRTAEPVFHLAKLLAHRGDWTQAERFYRQAMLAGGEVYVRENAWGVKAKLELASVLRQRGSIGEAVMLIGQAIDQTPIERTNDQLSAQAVLIESLLSRELVSEALQASELLEVQSRPFLEQDAVVRLDCLRWRLSCLREAGRFAEAREVDFQARKIASKLATEAKEFYGSARAVRTAEWLMMHGEWSAADKLYALMQSELDRRVIAKHPDSATLMAQIGSWHEWHGRLDEALELFDKCWRIRDELLGDDHLATQDARLLLATCLLQRGTHAAGEKIIQEVLDRRIHDFGELHPATWRVMLLQSQQCQRAGKWNEALEILESVARNQAQVLHPDDRRRHDLRMNFIDCCLAAGWLARAHSLIDQAEQRWVNPGNRSATRAWELSLRRAELRLAEQRWEDAGKQCEEVWQTASEMWSTADPRRVQALDLLIRYYTLTGNHEPRLKALQIERSTIRVGPRNNT